MTRISETEIRQAITEITRELDNLSTEMGKMNEIESSLQSAWTDETTQRSASKFLDAVQKEQANLQRIVNKLSELPGILTRAAESYTDIKVGGAE